MGKQLINHPPVITINTWYGYHCQSWVVIMALFYLHLSYINHPLIMYESDIDQMLIVYQSSMNHVCVLVILSYFYFATHAISLMAFETQKWFPFRRRFPWFSLQVLRAHRIKLENMGRVGTSGMEVTGWSRMFCPQQHGDKR